MSARVSERGILSFGRRREAYAASACSAAVLDRVGMLCSSAACLSVVTLDRAGVGHVVLCSSFREKEAKEVCAQRQRCSAAALG